MRGGLLKHWDQLRNLRWQNSFAPVEIAQPLGLLVLHALTRLAFSDGILDVLHACVPVSVHLLARAFLLLHDLCSRLKQHAIEHLCWGGLFIGVV